uniref:Uncharacterized protein n=1 Tax=Glossina pallidipes TaxID=7398 RepID=A0A1A9ZEC5_GLOPL
MYLYLEKNMERNHGALVTDVPSLVKELGISKATAYRSIDTLTKSGHLMRRHRNLFEINPDGAWKGKLDRKNNATFMKSGNKSVTNKSRLILKPGRGKGKMTPTEMIIVEAENFISRYGPHGMSQWEWDFLNGSTNHAKHNTKNPAGNSIKFTAPALKAVQNAAAVRTGWVRADTLIRRQFPGNIDLLIVDEAHMRRKKLLEIIRDTDIRVVGLSGTLFASWMGKYYEKLIKPTTMRELIRLGDLSPYEFYAPDRPDVSSVKTSNLAAYGQDYNEEQLAVIMGDATLVATLYATGWKTAKTDQRSAFASTSVMLTMSHDSL